MDLEKRITLDETAERLSTSRPARSASGSHRAVPAYRIGRTKIFVNTDNLDKLIPPDQAGRGR